MAAKQSTKRGRPPCPCIGAAAKAQHELFDFIVPWGEDRRYWRCRLCGTVYRKEPTV